DSPYTASPVAGDVHTAVSALRQARGPKGCVIRAWYFVHPREPIRKYLELRCRVAASHWQENHIEPRLAILAVPGSMKGDEHPVAVAGRKPLPRIVQDVHRCPVPRKRGSSTLCLRAATHLASPGSAVLRCQHLPRVRPAELAVRPADVVASRHQLELLGRILRTGFFVEVPAPVLNELVTAMLNRPEPAIRIKSHRDGVPDSGSPACGIRQPLSDFVRVEAPDTGTGLELDAWINYGALLSTILHLA